MKKSVAIILMLVSINIFGQNLSELGIDNNPKLTQAESEFLNEYMNEKQRKGFDLTEKKVIFIKGPGGSTIGSKSEYFNHIRMYNENGNKIATWIVELNEKERLESGYDVIVTYWVKLLTKRRKRIIINEIKPSR